MADATVAADPGAGGRGSHSPPAPDAAEPSPPFYVRYYVGHRGKFGHEFLELEITAAPDGKGPGRLRYANQSSYKKGSRIRKEAWISNAVVAEAERIVREACVIECDDEQWPEPDEVGRQELEVVTKDEHICFACAKVGTLAQAQACDDPKGLTRFYYLSQDLKALVFGLISMHFKIKPIPRVAAFDADRADFASRIRDLAVPHEEIHHLRWELRSRDAEIEDLQRAVRDAQVYLYDERETVLRLQTECEGLKIRDFENRRRVQHLLALTQPVTHETTFFREGVSLGVGAAEGRSRAARERSRSNGRAKRAPPAAVAPATAAESVPPPTHVGHYLIGKTLGQGTFGKVKLGTHILTGENVAVKVLEKARIKEIADVTRVTREIKIFKKLEHPFLCRLYELIEGIDYLHDIGVVHRDLKPENILLMDKAAPDGGMAVKVIDFGLSNTFVQGSTLTTACGSPAYASPEMILRVAGGYNPRKSDLWSLGVVLFAMVAGCLPFEHDNTAALYDQILNARYRCPSHLSPACKDLISRILVIDPRRRFGAEEATEVA
ncbi:hypothetical protein FNF28_03074 [Cafeteria roenbergensis]|uniref:Protein kinase domain-containing protein n=1 Tax=Cafeteria roenbergensis TaxID=33653 RepID=A0A5A8DLW0_CAFRO|nr:hypothetical protein FNF28_03074 [Cafeteria roenbergensis]